MTYKTAQHFDFSKYFDEEYMDNMIYFFFSDRKTAINILQRLMPLDTFRAYSAHALNHQYLQKHNDVDVVQAFEEFINDKIVQSGEITQFRETPRSTLRDAHEHSLKKHEFSNIRQYITHDSTIFKTLPVIHSLVLNYLKDLESYFKNLDGNYQKLASLYEIDNFLEFFDIKTFAVELAPTLIHGLPDEKQNAENLSSEDWKSAIKYLFSDEINTFRTTHGLCPFSKLIRQIFATNFGWDENNKVVNLPNSEGGAFPVFLIEWLNSQDSKLIPPHGAPTAQTMG